MTKIEKARYLIRDTIGIYSFGLYGIEVKDFIYDIDNYIVYEINEKVHKTKIYCNNKGLYFVYNNMRIHLNDVLAV